MSALAIIKPVVVTDTMLTSNVPETDYPAWNAATAYLVGDRAIRTTSATHKIYERIVAGTTATAPENDTTNWLEISATNRWKMFDQKIGTQTERSANITLTITPGQAVNAVAFLGLIATTLRVKMTELVDGTVFDETYSLQDPPSESSFWSYIYDPITARETLTVTGMPSYNACSLEITITHPVTAACGVCLIGTARTFGEGVKAGARVGIVDYSRKEKDDFGNWQVVERAFSKRCNIEMVVANRSTDALQRFLAEIRAVPTLWIGSNSFDSLVIYGFYKDFEITIAYASHALCTLEIEGLT
jgi:hypothetical protein